MSACEELDGSPKNQVMRFQTIAPINPPRMTFASTNDDVDHPLADRARDRRPDGE